MDITLQAHREVARSQAICHLCHTNCRRVHIPGPSTLPAQNGVSASRASSPSVDSSSGIVPGVPTKDGTIYFECLECKRSIASNRYAPHLSSCMGLGTGARRTAARTVTTKVSSDAGRSESPYLGSENGHVSDDSELTPKANKSKSKAKRKEEAEFNLHRKRAGSPQLSPPKKGRKAKVSSSPAPPGTPVNGFPGSQGSQSKVPSRLRESSTAAILDGSRQGSSSLDSASGDEDSPLMAAVGGPPPVKRGRGRPRKVIQEQKAPSPPRLPPPPPAPPVHVPDPDYIGDGGDETGSSTDTDSD